MEIIAKSIHTQGRAKEFFRFHLLKRSTSKYIYFIMSIIFFIIGVVLFFLGNYYNALFFLFVSVMLIIVRIVTVNFTINKILKNNLFPTVNYTLKISSDFIIYQADNEKKKYLWSDFFEAYETDNYFYFYINKNSALILSKYIISKEERNSLAMIILESNVKFRKIKFK